MTQDEAQAIARQRYGPKTYVKTNHEGIHDILIANYGNNAAKLPALLGWGKTWEEALELAEVRKAWHTIEKPEPEQLQLF